MKRRGGSPLAPCKSLRGFIVTMAHSTISDSCYKQAGVDQCRAPVHLHANPIPKLQLPKSTRHTVHARQQPAHTVRTKLRTWAFSPFLNGNSGGQFSCTAGGLPQVPSELCSDSYSCLSLLQEVREVGCFSLDEHRAFHDDNRSLSEYAPPSLGCSLSDGYPDRFVEFPEDQQKTEHLDSLLRWLNVHVQDKGFEFPDFICWRGLFTKVMCAPFSPSNELRISIVKHKGVFYMVEFETENEKKKRDMRSEKDKLMCYWGHRFEGFATRARHDPTQRPSQHTSELSASAHVTNTNVAFCTVVRTKLEKHTLLMGAEIDCISSNGAYIELKTSQTISHPRQKNSFLRYFP